MNAPRIDWSRVLEFTWRSLVFLVAIAIIAIVSTNWNRWEGGEGWQRTNDAYLDEAGGNSQFVNTSPVWVCLQRQLTQSFVLLNTIVQSRPTTRPPNVRPSCSGAQHMGPVAAASARVSCGAIRPWTPAQSRRSQLISSPHARSIATMASTSAAAASFTTRGLPTDYSTDRWKTSPWSVSLGAAASESDMSSYASIVARLLSGRARAWENAAIAS